MSTHRTLHASLGGGKVADIMLWEDKKSAAAILLGFTTLWFLVRVKEYPFVTLLCDALMVCMAAGVFWCKIARRIFNRTPSEIYIQLPGSACIFFFVTVNWFQLKFCEISSGKKISDSSLWYVMAGLYTLSYKGAYVSSLNLIYTVILSVGTLPALYESQVSTIAVSCIGALKKLCRLFQVKVLDKIPRHKRSD